MRNFENRYGIVYLVTNLNNGKRYVGKTVEGLETRWYNHVRHAKSKRCPTMVLHAAILKHGSELFSIETICTAREFLLSNLEKFFIQHYGTKIEGGRGYNMTNGGDGVSGCRPKEETRIKMSKALIGNQRGKGRKLTPQEIEHLRSFTKGRKATPEQLEERSKKEREKWNVACKKGHVRTPENTKTYLKASNGKETRDCQDCRKESPSRQKPTKPEPTGLCHKGKHLWIDSNKAVYIGKDKFTRTRCRDCDREYKQTHPNKRKSRA